MKLAAFFLLLIPLSAVADQSISYGTTSNGSLENGSQLPSEGSNFIGYSTVARLAGRTYVHSEVKEIIVSAYKSLEISMPGKVFKYAETGFEEGGQFRPHKTHQNGLSVDFMTPMISPGGVSEHLPTHPFNKFGYNIEIDPEGNYGDLKVDYAALAAHIVELDKEAKRKGYKLWRVIFDPKLRPYLFVTEYGNYLQDNVQFSKKRSWVRHDEHYHVDFEIPCK